MIFIYFIVVMICVLMLLFCISKQLANFTIIKDYMYFVDDSYVDFGLIPWIVKYDPYISIYWIGSELTIRWRKK